MAGRLAPTYLEDLLEPKDVPARLDDSAVASGLCRIGKVASRLAPQEVEQRADLETELSGVSHLLLAIDGVVVASSCALAGDVAAFD